jgi:hypothetical protein
MCRSDLNSLISSGKKLHNKLFIVTIYRQVIADRWGNLIMNTALYTPIVDDDRRLHRADIAIAAGIRTARGRRIPVTVRNISTNGFMAEGGANMVPGVPVTLDLNGTTIEARIVWKRAGHVGGAFLNPIDGETLAGLGPQSRHL